MKRLLSLASALLLMSCASKPAVTGAMKADGCSGGACCAPSGAASCCDAADVHKH